MQMIGKCAAAAAILALAMLTVPAFAQSGPEPGLSDSAISQKLENGTSLKGCNDTYVIEGRS
jgi:hypothetical protein